MKKVKYYLAFCAVLALLIVSCSKDENSSKSVEEPSFAELTFEAALNDLVNRAAVSVNKGHFNQIPDCSSEAPASVSLTYSYNGNQYETDIEILFDGSVYFTDYSEDLKIPVEDGGMTIVTLEEFVVYDAGGEIIWIAPISSEVGQFDGYVDNPLPFDIEVRDGTKPYIPVEVLCYDRRMANEYGYVFFDLENTELINFCIFGNFCPPSGRHYLAAYSVNVWTVNEAGDNVEQIYTDLTRDIQGGGEEELSADPLCIVLPDRLGEEDRYRIEISILDGPDYDTNEGEVIRTSILTDQEVRTFFDGDDNLEYFHFFEGCDEPDTPPIFDDPRDNKMTYKACAKELNDSGVIALVAATIEGSNLSVTVLATGMEDGMPHFQHFHGPGEGESDATCDNYGAPIYPLNLAGGDFPTTDGNGNYIYQRTFPTLSAEDKANLTPLDQTVVVLHGITGNPGLPVACGELELVE